jgi:hypothetical protein
MEIQIIPEGNSKNSLLNLKQFIERASIEGISKTKIERANHYPGQMGAGEILGSIRTILEAANKPLVELVGCLHAYVTNYRTEITIPTPNGNIIISHGRSMKPGELEALAVSIQKALSGA